MEEKFFAAASSGDLTFLKETLPKNPKLIEIKQGDYGNTPLLEAAQMGHLEVVQWLLSEEGGASITEENSSFGENIVFHAAISGQHEVVKWILEKYDLPVHQENGYLTLLQAAFISTNLKLVEYLFEKGASIDEVAAEPQYKGLIPADAEVFEKTKQAPKVQNTINLHISLLKEEYSNARDLLNQDVYVNFTDISGNTLLHRLLINYHSYRESMVKTLLKKDAKIYCKNSESKYPIDYLKKEDPLYSLFVPKNLEFITHILHTSLEKLMRKVIESFYVPSCDFIVSTYKGEKFELPKYCVSELLCEEIGNLLAHEEMKIFQLKPEYRSFLKEILNMKKKKDKLLRECDGHLDYYELTETESNNLAALIKNLQILNHHIYQKERSFSLGIEMPGIRVVGSFIEQYKLKSITEEDKPSFPFFRKHPSDNTDDVSHKSLKKQKYHVDSKQGGKDEKISLSNKHNNVRKN